MVLETGLAIVVVLLIKKLISKSSLTSPERQRALVREIEQMQAGLKQPVSMSPAPSPAPDINAFFSARMAAQSRHEPPLPASPPAASPPAFNAQARRKKLLHNPPAATDEDDAPRQNERTLDLASDLEADCEATRRKKEEDERHNKARETTAVDMRRRQNQLRLERQAREAALYNEQDPGRSITELRERKRDRGYGR